VGLAAGIIFVVLFTVYLSSNPFQFRTEKPRQYQNLEYSSAWIKLTKELDEVKAFLAYYPAAKTTVYGNVRIVDYSVFDSSSLKVASLRIVIGMDNNSILSINLECGTVDAETSEIARESIKEAHGQRISGVNEFFSDDKCPRIK
jgi:hypothetical protein